MSSPILIACARKGRPFHDHRSLNVMRDIFSQPCAEFAFWIGEAYAEPASVAGFFDILSLLKGLGQKD